MAKRIPFIIFSLLIVGLIVGLFIYVGNHMAVEYSKTEVDSYMEEFEITHMAYAEESFSETMSTPVYRAAIRNENTAITIRITNEEFARYTSKDIVTVKVTVYEYSDGHQSKDYKIIGLVRTGDSK